VKKSVIAGSRCQHVRWSRRRSRRKDDRLAPEDGGRVGERHTAHGERHGALAKKVKGVAERDVLKGTQQYVGTYRTRNCELEAHRLQESPPPRTRGLRGLRRAPPKGPAPASSSRSSNDRKDD